MSYFFKNTRGLSLVLAALFLAITMTAGSFAYAANGSAVLDEEVVEDNAGDEFEYLEEGEYIEDMSLFGLDLTDMAAAAAYRAPDKMRGVYLVPGADFIKSPGAGEQAVRAEIDKAVANAKALDMNSVVIDTVYNDSVIFETADSKMIMPDFDAMRYLTDECRTAGLYVYAIFDASHYSGALADKLSANAGEFAAKYVPDGVLIDGYATGPVEASYSEYINEGGSIGYENYARQGSANIVKAVAGAVRKASPDTQTGILADAVWANASDNALGSDTSAEYTSLISGGADTRAYLENGFVDFAAVKAYSLLSDESVPFAEVASWWSDVAIQSDIPLYIVHASDKLGSGGWTYDELMEQASEAEKYGGCKGSIFNDMRKLPLDDAASSSAAASVQASVATQMPAVAPVSAPAPAPAPAPAAVSPGDGEYSWDDEDDEYSWDDEDDEYSWDEEDEEDEYSWDDEDDSYGSATGSGIIREISPSGIIFADGSDVIDITAVALRGSEVTAELNGETVFLEFDGYTDDPDYAWFSGVYEVPAPEYDDDIQMLGGLVVTADCDGEIETVDGAYLKVGKSRTPVRITADQARTYPANTKNNIPVPSMYPLPKGATDYAVGKTFSYTSAKKEKYTYVLLESGVRVETKDIKEVSRGPSKNKVSGMTVSAPGDGYTYVMFKTSQPVTFSFAYKGDSVQITFNYTTSVPDGRTLSKNPIFKKASWSGNNRLTLALNKSGGFAGYKAYYDKGNLIFKFNNPPASIKNTRIAIDPGHGGKDTGALGSNSKYYEAVINRAIAKHLSEALEAKGAKVNLMNTAGIEGPERAKLAEKWNADFLVSVHCNTSVNKNATGTEVYYFYPYSKPAAHYTASGVSKSFKTTNRGPKNSYYHVTLSPQMPSILVECGFMSNKAEYAKLIKSSHQKRIAAGIVSGLESAIKYSRTGKSATGTQSVGTKISL